jgi:hypothetical protein
VAELDQVGDGALFGTLRQLGVLTQHATRVTRRVRLPLPVLLLLGTLIQVYIVLELIKSLLRPAAPDVCLLMRVGGC